jgi:neutral amino acid transport system substrate-binding protein
VIITALSNEATGAVAAAASAIPVMSLTSTSSSLSLSYSNLFRVAPPEWAQALALTQTLIVDGNPKIAIIGSIDPAAVAYRTVLTQTFTEEKGLVLYGGLPTNSPAATPTPTPTPLPAPKPSTTPAPEQFTPGQATFATEVTAALATKPNAVVVVATTETSAILAELMKQGWKMPKTYLGDSNVTGYAGVFASGALLGAQGTIPGQSPSEELRNRLTAWTTQVKATTLTSVNYAAEAYDATVLAALAGAMYAKTSPVVVARNLPAVSGSYGGDKCDSYASCAKILDTNKLVSYRGPSTMGSFTATNEVSSAMVSIFQYNNENVPIWTGIQSVRSIKEPKK